MLYEVITKHQLLLKQYRICQQSVCKHWRNKRYKIERCHHSCLKGYLIISLSRPSKWKDKHEEHDEDDDEERVSLFTIANLRNIVMIFAGGGVAAAVLGYVALANFILYRIVATFLIVSGLSILKTALSETVTS